MKLTPELLARLPSCADDPGPSSSVKYLSDADIADSIESCLSRGPGHDNIWIFAYGSLLWNSGFEFVQRQTGTIYGWHRAFCLHTTRWRGTPTRPGLMLSLDHGGRCRGAALRIDRGRLYDTLVSLWRRELGPKPANQEPRWVMVQTATGRLPAIAFTANRAGISYAGKRAPEETARIMAQAVGAWGSCAAYLHNTVRQLEVLGIRDRMLLRLEDLVSQALSEEHDISRAKFRTGAHEFRSGS